MSVLRTIRDGQHLSDHSNLDHLFQRLLVDTVVRPDPAAVSCFQPAPADRRGALRDDRHPGKTGVFYTLGRAAGQLPARCPRIRGWSSTIPGRSPHLSHAMGGKDWESVCSPPDTPLSGAFIAEILI